MTDFERQIEDLVKRLTERFNLAIASAVDEKKTFEDGESIFCDALAVLDYYNCHDLESDQLVNFSKVAFFRKKYAKALYYASEAVRKGKTDERVENASRNLHSMAFKLFEILLVTTEDFHDQIDFESLQEYLLPEDYCMAMKNTFASRKNIKSDEDKAFLTSLLKKLSQELIRQGFRQKENGNAEGALLLFNTVIPYVTPKKARVLSSEMKELEAATA